MSSFPGAPRLLRGAIVGIDLFNPISSIIPFQFNPETVSRTLQPQGMGNQSGDTSEAMRLKGAPVENIKVDIELDATDKLGEGDKIAGDLGVYPQLSALEMLVYPKTTLVLANTALMLAGTLEIVPPMGPMTFLVWGIKRVLPVRLTDFSITEEAHDGNLNPIRAKVSLGMRVLSYNDLSVMTPGYWVYLTHQGIKEGMATINTFRDIRAVLGGDIELQLR